MMDLTKWRLPKANDMATWVFLILIKQLFWKAYRPRPNSFLNSAASSALGGLWHRAWCFGQKAEPL